MNPAASSVFDLARLHGRSTNSPFLGMELPGRIHTTIRRGILTVDDGVLVDAAQVAAAAESAR